MVDGSVGRTVSTGPDMGVSGCGVGLVHGLWVGECVDIIPAPLTGILVSPLALQAYHK